MAYSVEARFNTAVADLNNLLNEVERLLLQPSAEKIETLLLSLDRLEQMFVEFEQQQRESPVDSGGVDLRAEEGRWDGIRSRLQSAPGAIAKSAAQVGGMPALRAKHPPATGFWWYLDQEHAQRQRRAIRKLLTTVATLVIAIVGGYWLINTLFPPDPIAVLELQTGSTLDELAAVQDWQGGLAVVDEALKQAPDSIELLIWKSVLAEQAGDKRQAEQTLDWLKSLVPDHLPELWTQVGNRRLMIGNIEGAATAADQAIALAPNDPAAYLLQGSVAEARGDLSTAIQLLEKTSTLAMDTNPEIYVIARTRMGQLMQQNIVAPTSTLTTTN